MKFVVLFGDDRMKTVVKMVKDLGFECATNETFDASDIKGAIKNADAVILPLPCCKDGYLFSPMSNVLTNIGDIFSAGSEKTIFLGGKMPITDENHIDYSLREEFLIKNAVPTAEGAIEIALRESDITLNGANAAVIGYGRIGKYLSEILSGLNCNVSVVARKEVTRANAEISGFSAYNFGNTDVYKNADIVFNTVPTTVIGEDELSVMRPETKIIDLASLPGGVDEKSAKAHNVTIIRALALPGKVAPTTAGKIIFDTVTAILRERGVIL